ncbi:hypothetical protein PMAYCL1PPCAC_25912, partial [Pristionchus mayeri]
AENRRLNDRLEEAKVRIESLNDEKANMEHEVKNRFEESSEALSELDTVRFIMEEMERAGELKDKQIEVLEDENRRLFDKIYDSNISVSQCKEPKKIEEQHETLKMTE